MGKGDRRYVLCPIAAAGALHTAAFRRNRHGIGVEKGSNGGRIRLYTGGGCRHGFGSIFSTVRAWPDDMARAGSATQNGKLWRN